MEWTHLLCPTCWWELNPNRQPVQVLDSLTEPCCRCGADTADGICVRAHPDSMQCKGTGGMHEATPDED